MPDLEPALAHRTHLVQFLADLLGDLDQTQFRQAVRRPCDAMAARGVTATATQEIPAFSLSKWSAKPPLRAVDLLDVVFPSGRIVATDGMGKVGVGRQQQMAERLPEQHGSLSGH